jgi:spore maturation protein SpmB
MRPGGAPGEAPEPRAEPGPVPGIPARLRTGVVEGLRTSWLMVKYAFPLYVAVDLLKDTAAAGAAGRFFAPLMTLFGLPGEAAFAFIAAFLLNLYAAIAILVPLELTPWQVTVCGLMMGIAHNLLVEGGVLSSTGTRGAFLSLCRVVIAAAAGIAVNTVHAFWTG